MTGHNARKPRLLLLLTFLLRVGIGLFFMVTGLLKISSLNETADFLTRSSIFPECFSMPLACIGVAMELIVGICLLFRLAYRGAALWGCLMTSVFILLYTQAWIRGLELSCNCMGASHEIVNYPLDTAVRVFLLGAMLILIWDSRQSSTYLWKFRRLDFSDV